MYGIDQTSVRAWNGWNDLPYPGVMVINCPGCGELMNFRAGDPTFDRMMDTISTKSECPSCRQIISIWAIHPKPGTREDESIEKCDAVGIFPPPRQKARTAIEGSNLLSDRLRRQYRSVLAVYNAGAYDATANQCRVTLEGIVKNLVPTAKPPLANQLRELSTLPDLGKPLITLSHALRTGGNIGSHFDEDKETDQATAETMIDLLEYLLEYVYALPAMVDELDRKIAALGNKSGGATTT